MLVSVHHIRHAPSVRAAAQQRDGRHRGHLHPESGAPQLGRQPPHLFHVLGKLQ